MQISLIAPFDWDCREHRSDHFGNVCSLASSSQLRLKYVRIDRGAVSLSQKSVFRLLLFTPGLNERPLRLWPSFLCGWGPRGPVSTSRNLTKESYVTILADGEEVGHIYSFFGDCIGVLWDHRSCLNLVQGLLRFTRHTTKYWLAFLTAKPGTWILQLHRDWWLKIYDNIALHLQSRKYIRSMFKML